MIIWGKIVGALIGLIIYGPPGLILGLVFGQIFDNGLRNILLTPRHSAEVRAEFFKAVFQAMGYISKADGMISENEIKVARDIMLHNFSLNAAQTNLAIRYFNEGKQPGFNLTALLTKFKSICGNYVDLTRFFLELQVKSAMADKLLHEAQRNELVYICSTLHIPLSELNYLLQSYGYTFYEHSQHQHQHHHHHHHHHHYTYSDKLTAAYKLLGVSTNDNLKTIKAAYRRMISKYHPDKLFAKGLPPEMMTVAKEKTQQITVAYDLIIQSRQ